MNTSAKRPLDVCIRGGGPVGASLALALSRLGWQVGLVSPAAPARSGPDVRTYALNAGSAQLLRELRVWDAMPADAITAVNEMQIDGDAGGHLAFSAWQQSVDALAWIVDAAALDAALAEALRYAPHVQRLDQNAPAALLAVCEGRDSATREALGAVYESWPYGHRAVAARLVADAPHHGIARQWFRSPDILALLPFDRPALGRSYGLVWSLPEARATELMALTPADFEAALDQATGGAAGSLRLDGERAGWALMLARAQRWIGPGWALLGDAAHAVHPLSGQGLNLGLADVRCLVRVLDEARRASPWRSAGDERTLRRYARERQAPTRLMGTLTDGLLQLFAAPPGPLKDLRNQGLSLVDRLRPVKRWLAARALDT